MTALSVSSARRSVLSSGSSHGLAHGLVATFRRAVAAVNAVEAPRTRENARSKAAASANGLLRHHGSMTVTL